jgi:cell division protein FtsI (penicillin-binding protein 3)
VSSNIGAAKIGERLGRERFDAFLDGLEIGRPTGIDLPGEVGGRLRPARSWSRIGLVTTSFGQGVAVTPLHMARAFAAIANGGLLMQPYVGMRAIGADGRTVWERSPTVVRRVMRPETARQVTAMLETVVDGEGGTGTRARVAGVRVAGKTGTAQKVEPGTGRYSARGRIASFVGFVPADAPRLVILTLLDEPESSTYGGIVAAPIFREIAVAALERLGVAVAPPADVREAALDADQDGRAPFVPAGVPSFLGLSMRDAVERARELGWVVQVRGRGYVTTQAPPPGAVAAPGKELVLNLTPASDFL